MGDIETKNEPLCLHCFFGRCMLAGGAESCPYGTVDWDARCERYEKMHGDIEEYFVDLDVRCELYEKMHGDIEEHFERRKKNL